MNDAQVINRLLPDKSSEVLALIEELGLSILSVTHEEHM